MGDVQQQCRQHLETTHDTLLAEVQMLASRAEDCQQDEATFARLAFAQHDLEDTRTALRRLAAGTYGTCETCGREIDAERLLAMPTATQCINCRRKRQHKTIRSVAMRRSKHAA